MLSRSSLWETHCSRSARYRTGPCRSSPPERHSQRPRTERCAQRPRAAAAQQPRSMRPGRPGTPLKAPWKWKTRNVKARKQDERTSRRFSPGEPSHKSREDRQERQSREARQQLASAVSDQGAVGLVCLRICHGGQCGGGRVGCVTHLLSVGCGMRCRATAVLFPGGIEL